MLAPIAGPAWSYRRRARLSVRDVQKKGEVLVGFHERASSYVAQMDACEVLGHKASQLIPALKRLIESLSIRQRVPQIEIAEGGEVLALVFRILEPPSNEDCEALIAFGRLHSLEIWLQTKGPESISLIYPERSVLAYQLSDFNLTYPFLPTDFTQVNHGVNEVLVRKAIRLLSLVQEDRVLDLFCGLGNFSLALARTAHYVTGVEGSESLVSRAQAQRPPGFARPAVFDARAAFGQLAHLLKSAGLAQAHLGLDLDFWPVADYRLLCEVLPRVVWR
ncbi:MAG: hypothetical protein EBW84_13170, partial [Betaproteobacteria bacterium]|nr:hypothetical protein [Betaproteobacteria bacterium]